MSAILVAGTEFLDRRLASLRRRVDDAGVTPQMAVIVLGHDPIDRANAERKVVAGSRAGVEVRVVSVPVDAASDEVSRAICDVVNTSALDGVLVQLPVSEATGAQALLDLVPPTLDIDGLSSRSLARLMSNQAGFRPATATAIIELLADADIDPVGRTAVVVGTGPYVARPVAMMLADAGAAVTMVGADHRQLARHTAAADIVICAADRAHLLQAASIAPGAAVVDAGVHRRRGRLVGDVDTAGVAQRASVLVPMPGGVGPATIAVLLEATAATAIGAVPDA